MGAAKTPDLYRAAASYAGVSDIEMTLSDWERYEETLDMVEQMIGGERGDKERLRLHSPLRRADEVRIPVLLGHGADDPTVHVKQSQRMAKALRAAGRNVEYVEFPDEVHGFLLEANRIRWYEALIAFFEKNLAPREKAAEVAAPAP
jgi:dipeptidyl aminopeptidase/acylaminoacyl peptidase